MELLKSHLQNLLYSIAVISLICPVITSATKADHGKGCIGRDKKWHESKALKEKRIAWWRKAKFGMFIHWGIYAVPGGEWKGDKVEGYSEWIMWKEQIPVKEYEKLAEKFNPVKFDAEKWAGLAGQAGMKYMVITAKHHDGFAMYPTKVNNYDIIDATPFKRDPIKELAESCRKRGIKFGCYYSVDRDWHHPDAFCPNQNEGNTWDYPDTTREDFDRYLKQKAIPQLKELLINYSPEIMWFDGVGTKTAEQNENIIAMVRRLQPDCLINSRLGDWKSFKWGDYRSMDDDDVADELLPYGWENPGTMNKTYGYSKNATDWRTPKSTIRMLVDIASKGGNYLLNVGPRADGTIPAQAVRILQETGKWLDKYGESIYGSEGSPIGRPDWGRCTAKKDKLYLHIFDWPENDKLTVPSVGNKVKKAYYLADPRKKPLQFKHRDNAGIVIKLGAINQPIEFLDSNDTVIVLKLAS